MERQHSKGTIAVMGDTEFFVCNGDVFQANMKDLPEVGQNGYRQNCRWLCTWAAWHSFVRMMAAEQKRVDDLTEDLDMACSKLAKMAVN
jgi:hypothetical protein